ncbi:hypothetical protein V6R21_15420 [Limibacter armeniacum]|uniref:hypothetical protein n=1 Tax=Limibacter armeniacum TaxID=466084 RepID=UPI002FE65653
MNTIRRFSLLFAALVMLMSFSYANDKEKNKKKAQEIEYIRSAVENGSKGDWNLYARAAQICINRGYNMDQAYEWVSHSIDLHNNPLNNEILGDYYMRMGDTIGAYEVYHDTVSKFMFEMKDEELSRLQLKIRMVTNELRKNP